MSPSSSSPATGKPPSTKTKTKKTFSKVGQKRSTPPESDGVYRFYTSLLQQNPKSMMALKWCLEHGVFSKSKAEKVALQLQMANMKIKE